MGEQDAGRSDLSGAITSSSTFGTYVEAYRMAAGLLVDDVLAGRGAHDILIYPIGYAYRHALELALKDANYWVASFVNGWARTGRIDQSEVRSTAQLDRELNGHSLTDLKAQLERRLDAIYRFAWIDESVAAAIGAMNSIDEDGQRFRYPFRTRGRGPSFSPEHFRSVDLSVLRTAIEAAIGFLTFALRLKLGRDISADIEANEAWLTELRRQEAEETLWHPGAYFDVLTDSDDEELYLQQWELGPLADRAAEMLDDGDDP